MRDLIVDLICFTPKTHTPYPLREAEAYRYFEDGKEIIKVFKTRHEIESQHVVIEGGKIVLGEQIYTINSVTYDEKRPKYANCQVTLDTTERN